jgi:hypothetical protein
MTLFDLIRILENKIVNLSQLKTAAGAIGDVEQVVKLEEDEAATSTLIGQLKQVAAIGVE